MTRKDKVLAALMDLTQSRAGSSKHALLEGFTTDEIAASAGVLRSNCSAELNVMVRDGLVEKTPGRPALYRLTKDASSEHASFLRPSEKSLSRRGAREDEFDWGVATERSLHSAVQQAKMALTYPPHGMHVLLLGETGVGKSTFSRRMHEYAVRYGVLQDGAPFVTFNCSEYANNPEILLDQLFGHTRGAYTGAHSDKAGLVEQANQGMLFLDEVHRLPPQGQEMLFHLLDYGRFRRLGETENDRSSQVLIVAATTESPESALLSTFRRRIPVVIRLPALREWALYDRYELVYAICREEARILLRSVHLSAPALEILLFSRFSANIGDLKNTVKLACARAFNDGTRSDNRNASNFKPLSDPARSHRGLAAIEVLPEHVVVAATDGPTEVLLRRLSQSSDLLVTPDSDGPPPLPMLEEGSRYAKLDRLSQTLYELGFDTEEIIDSLERELQKQERSGSQAPVSVADLEQFVGEPLFSVMVRAWQEIEKGLPNGESEAAFLRVAVHLYGVIRSAHSLSEIPEGGLIEVFERVRLDSPESYRMSGRLLATFSALTGVSLPKHETAIVAMLLRPKEGEVRRHIGLVVVLFGDGIARNIVDTATRLTPGTGAIAIDIPFQTPIEVMGHRISEAVRRADEGKGVLLLTDIPWLAEGKGWQPPSGVSVERVLRPDLRTTVSALQGIQTGRMPLEQLAGWLQARNQDTVMMKPGQKRVVWGCCLTGKGTARAVERLIRDALPSDLSDSVVIIPKELAHSETPLVPDMGLVATVGSVDPGVFGVPFFSVETLLTKEGIDQLLNVLYLGDSVSLDQSGAEPSPPELSPPELSPPAVDVARQVKTSLHSGAGAADQAESGSAPTTDEMEAYISNLLHRDLVFVNPALALRASKQVWETMNGLLTEEGLEVNLRRETFVRFCLHTAYVIERLIRQDEMVHPYAKRIAERYPVEWAVMTRAWQPIMDIFRLSINVHELGYLFELVFADRELEVFG